jgi:photosystem II stability/assembly factor-like uncharacterized protein
MLATISPTPTTVPPEFKLHFPYMLRRGPLPRIEVQAAWTANKDGNPSVVFLPNDQVQYIANLINYRNKTLLVSLSWTQAGPCGEIVIANKSVTLAPGEQQLMVEGIIPDCPGIYSATVEITDQENKISDTILLVANPLSLVAVETNQGFDKCTVPTISQMQTWWVESPYWAVNMYIGGISRACDQPNLTPYWINAVSQQGWTFIPTWVGPQAPCSSFRHRISSDPDTAYLEGKDEADMAVDAAIELGLWGDMVIYYDLEGYSGGTSCRDTVATFMKGWVERLHQLGYQAGVYGSPCRSYLTDFSAINPVPDDVWIASWLTPARYRSDATVWLSGDAEQCLSNELWVNHQRIRQYSGGHSETYGELTFSIDSNALDGQVTVLPTPTPATAAQTVVGEGADALVVAASQPQLRAMQPLSARSGWVLAGENLLLTSDGGATWQDITPGQTSLAHIYAVTFVNPQQGWLVHGPAAEGGQDPLEVLMTQDGGLTWQVFPSALPDDPGSAPSAAYLNFVDDNTGFLAVKLESSSAFSLGRLFATQDSGRTWQERSLPLGEPVSFVDAQRGWIAGGPGGDLLFQTVDGGRNWHPQSLPLPLSGVQNQVLAGLPVFHNEKEGILPLTQTGLDPRLLVYATGDGGETWSLSGQVELAEEPGIALPFSADPSGRWRAATPGTNRLWVSQGLREHTTQFETFGSPPGVTALDFLDSQYGWALTQNGVCRGEKIPFGQALPAGAQPLHCAAQSYLLKTADGGRTWSEITP